MTPNANGGSGNGRSHDNSRSNGIAGKAIDVRDLTRRFGAFTAVDRISFDVAAGEVFGFLGANGAGKTTAIRMLIGLLAPSGGSARVAGVGGATQAEQPQRRNRLINPRLSPYQGLPLPGKITPYRGIF